MNACPTPEQLDALLSDDLDAARRAALEAHLGACSRCQRQLLHLAGEIDVPTSPIDEERDGPAQRFLDELKSLVYRDANWEAPHPVIDGLEVLEEIGRGGMGIVYRARQLGLNRVVALKVLPKRMPGLSLEREWVRRGPEAIARLPHPNVVQIHRVGEESEYYYGILEYLGGGSLADRIKGVPWPSQRAAELIRTLAGAVDFIHGHGVIHRDLKPTNILFAEDGTPKVVDFGIAHLLDKGDDPTRPGDVIGSPAYMAPEQAAGRVFHIEPAADLYSVGVILYELLTGRPPFHAGTRDQILRQVIHESPPSLGPDVPPELAAICLRCLEKHPHARFRSGRELGDALDAFLLGL